MAISVIIPAAPMEELLWRLELVLEGLTVQTLAPTEVIVVDSVGQGDDSVSRVVAKFADKLPIRSYQMPPSSHGSVFRAGEGEITVSRSYEYLCPAICSLMRIVCQSIRY